MVPSILGMHRRVVNLGTAKPSHQIREKCKCSICLQVSIYFHFFLLFPSLPLQPYGCKSKNVVKNCTIKHFWWREDINHVISPYPFNLAAYVVTEKIVFFSYLRLGSSSLVRWEFSNSKRGYGIFMQACSQNSPCLFCKVHSSLVKHQLNTHSLDLSGKSKVHRQCFSVLEIPSSSFGWFVLDLDHFKAYLANF